MSTKLQIRLGFSADIEPGYRDGMIQRLKQLIKDYGTDPVKGVFNKQISVSPESFDSLQKTIYVPALVDSVRIAVLGPGATQADKLKFAQFKSNKVSGVKCVYFIVEKEIISDDLARHIPKTHDAAVDMMRFILQRGVA